MTACELLCNNECMSDAAGLFIAGAGLFVLAIAMLYYSTRNPRSKGPRDRMK